MKKLLLIFTFFLLVSCSDKINNVNPKLEIHFIDVGQADSIYIKLPNGEHMLIDAGNNSDGPIVLEYLRNQKVSSLDYLIGTHPHEDHIGGLDDVINNLEIHNIYMPNLPEKDQPGTKTYSDVLEAIEAKNLSITSARAGKKLFDKLINGSVLSAVFLSPINESYSNINDYSAVIKLTYLNTTYLFTGDAEEGAEELIIDSNVDLKADVLKLGHHGSRTSTSESFLNLVDPNIAIISVGEDNVYEHPNLDTIGKLTNKAIDYYRTDIQGTIVLESDGIDISVNKRNIDEPNIDSNEGLGKILINEFLPNPSNGEEWIELYNGTDEPINISGYIIDDIEGGSTPKTIDLGEVIEANGYYIIKVSNFLNNTGDEVRLINKYGTLIDTYIYTSSEQNKSWCRVSDGGSWSQELCVYPTLGLSNN